MIFAHGSSVYVSLVSWVTFDAASPMISMDFTIERTSIRSESRSPRLLFLAKDRASFAASSMCRIRIRSSLRILNLRRIEHLLSEIATQFCWCPQINLPLENPRKLDLHPCQTQQAHPLTRFEFTKDIPVVTR